jgi:hypothetical protein
MCLFTLNLTLMIVKVDLVKIKTLSTFRHQVNEGACFSSAITHCPESAIHMHVASGVSLGT